MDLSYLMFVEKDCDGNCKVTLAPSWRLSPCHQHYLLILTLLLLVYSFRCGKRGLIGKTEGTRE